MERISSCWRPEYFVSYFSCNIDEIDLTFLKSLCDVKHFIKALSSGELFLSSDWHMQIQHWCNRLNLGTEKYSSFGEEC